jgi:hypothetical protein
MRKESCWFLVVGGWRILVGRESFSIRWRKRHSFVRASGVFSNLAKRSQEMRGLFRDPCASSVKVGVKEIGEERGEVDDSVDVKSL